MSRKSSRKQLKIDEVIWKKDLEHIGSDNISGEEEQGRSIVLSIAVV